MRRLWIGILLAVITLLLTGCSDFVDQDQLSVMPEGGVTLEAGHPAGQTFVAHHEGLNAVEVYLSPATDAQGTVVLHLRESPISATDILTAGISISTESQAAFHRFSFPPIRHSHSRYYYAFLEQEGSGQVIVHTGDLGSYLDGVLYYDHEPQESQAVFRLSYDPLSIALDLLLMVACWVGYGAAGLTILFFSGYWIVRRWSRQTSVDFTSVLILSVVSALAAWMVFLVWASVFGMHLKASNTRLIVGISALVGLAYFIKDKEQWWRREYWLGENPLITLALWGVIALSIALRLFVGRGMVMLPGSDTYHHTLIVQLFEEHGGIPRSYEPYAPLSSFSYHFGFHSIAALFRWLLKTELLVTTKNLALVLNGAIAATVGLLSERVAGSRRAGVIAAAFVGLIAVSPFCLLCWGRFTQTTGLLFLAVGLLALRARGERAGWAFSPLLLAGMVLSHYRIAFFWGLFVMVAGGMKILRHRWDEIRDWLVIGMISVALVAPWLLRAAWIQYDVYGLRTTYLALEGFNDARRLGDPVLSFVTNGPVLVGSALLAAVTWFDRRNRTIGRTIVVWGVVLAGGSFALSFLGPVFSLWDLPTTLLSLTVPLAVLVGLAGDALWNAFGSKGRLVVRAGLTIVLLAGVITGVSHLPRLVHTEFLYLRPVDLVAMEWIEQNISEDAFFLANSLRFEWFPDWIVGSDAGYWIPLLAHRATTPPAMIYPMEWGGSPRLSAGLGALDELMRGRRNGTPPIGEVLDRYGITHVFTGARNWPLAPQESSRETHLREIYHQDQVRVFEVVQ